MKNVLFFALFFLYGLVSWAQPTEPVTREHLEKDFGEYSPVLFELYRDCHHEPELGLNCFKTKQKILNALDQLNMKPGVDYELIEYLAESGFVIILRNGAGPVLAWRFDMDALPITEATGLPYAAPTSLKAMHACSHDVAIANGIGILAQMHRNRQAWSGSAVFIAEPGEEGANGARKMVEEGMYQILAEKKAFPEKIVFIHGFDQLPAGAVGLRSGETMAGVATWNLTIRAKGGHGGRGGSINEIANDFEDFYYRIPTRVSPFEDFSVNITGRVMDTTINVNPETITLKLSARFMNMAMKDSMERFFIPRICKGLIHIYDLPENTFSLSSIFWSHQLVNDDSLYNRMKQLMPGLMANPNALRPIGPIMSSEDATWFSTDILHPDGKRRNIPILMVRLGLQDPAKFGTDFRQLNPLEDLGKVHSSTLAPVYDKAIQTGVVVIGGAFMQLFRYRS